MEASVAIKEGFTLYSTTQGTGPHDAAVWPPAPLKDEAGEQLYYYSGDTLAGETNGASIDGWTVYTGATIPAEAPAASPDAAAAPASTATGTPTGADPATVPAPFGTAQPDPNHAPAAAAQEQATVGSAGLGEGQPTEPQASQDTPPVGSTDPSAQSGVPLPEDRAAGVQPDPTVAGMVAPDAPPVAPVPAQPASPEGSAQPVDKAHTAEEDQKAALAAEKTAELDEEAALAAEQNAAPPSA